MCLVGQGPQGQFEIDIFRNETAVPSQPTGGSYNLDTGAFTPPIGWDANPTTPTGGRAVYASVAQIDPATQSGIVTPIWSVAFRAGSTGPAGPQGPQGDEGPAGPTGPAGADSTVPGPTGARGPQGAQGARGDTGPKGDKGDTGDTGARGPAGEGVPPRKITGAANVYTLTDAENLIMVELTILPTTNPRVISALIVRSELTSTPEKYVFDTRNPQNVASDGDNTMLGIVASISPQTCLLYTSPSPRDS